MLTMSFQADADDLDATIALLAGLKKRHAQTSDVPILIHTSGTGMFLDVPPNFDSSCRKLIVYSDQVF